MPLSLTIFAINDCYFKIKLIVLTSNIAKSDFHLLSNISGTHILSNDDVIHAVKEFLNGQEKNLFKSGIEVLQADW